MGDSSIPHRVLLLLLVQIAATEHGLESGERGGLSVRQPAWYYSRSCWIEAVVSRKLRGRDVAYRFELAEPVAESDATYSASSYTAACATRQIEEREANDEQLVCTQ